MRKALFLSTGGLSGVAVRANSKKERTAKAAEKQVRLQRQPRAQPVPASSPWSASSVLDTATLRIAGELGRVATLHKEGALTDDEFATAKAKILSS